MKQQPVPTIPCAKCHGSGAIKLTKALRSTLQAIIKLGSPTARQIHTHLKLRKKSHVSTTHRRTERLASLGLIASHREKINGKELEATFSEVKP